MFPIVKNIDSFSFFFSAYQNILGNWRLSVPYQLINHISHLSK